ncbi:CAP domain-containing protein [Phycicoccus sp. HDW14]|uniref:CAP domain-containing protein n=1 Tax=Phycicoccus sp. HDW14 TaxID=2714941 RepID=UPI00140CF21C|nr:CAP domain-containing protein [Phycicoccus sp. HDW14]QIM22450.1 CAP domain-containing protein [Phycicoccus sp. HDW14]
MTHPTLRSTALRALACTALLAPVGFVAAEPASAATNSQMQKDVITLVNAQRKKVGCAPLRTSTALRNAAVLHSVDMRTKNYFSHTSKDGRSPWDRIKAQKYPYGSAENIAAGQRTAKAVVDAWMKSTGHRKNILNCKNKAVGVGVSKGSGTYWIYWTQDFGTR